MTTHSTSRRRVTLNLLSYLVVALGLLVSALSIDYQSSITAFIGISLVFWGALLVYIKPSKYVPSSILNALSGEQMLKSHLSYDEAGYVGKPIYRAKTSLEEINDIEVLLRKNTATGREREVTTISPIGLGLHRLAEKEMEVNFNSVNFREINNKLGKCLIETLEVAESIRFTELNDAVEVEISGNVFHESLVKNYTYEASRPLGDPLISSIACILTRVYNSDVMIDEINLPRQKDRVIIRYKIMNGGGIKL